MAFSYQADWADEPGPGKVIQTGFGPVTVKQETWDAYSQAFARHTGRATPRKTAFLLARVAQHVAMHEFIMSGGRKITEL